MSFEITEQEKGYGARCSHCGSEFDLTLSSKCQSCGMPLSDERTQQVPPAKRPKAGGDGTSRKHATQAPENRVGNQKSGGHGFFTLLIFISIIIIVFLRIVISLVEPNNALAARIDEAASLILGLIVVFVFFAVIPYWSIRNIYRGIKNQAHRVELQHCRACGQTGLRQVEVREEFLGQIMKSVPVFENGTSTYKQLWHNRYVMVRVFRCPQCGDISSTSAYHSEIA